MCDPDPVLAKTPAVTNGHAINGHTPAAMEKGRAGNGQVRHTKGEGEVYFLPAAFGLLAVGSLATVAWKVFRG